MDTGLILTAAVVTAVFVWWLTSARKTSRNTVAPLLSPDVSFVSIPLLTDTHVLLYNLLRLAVHDRYLVFAHVPLWSFVRVDATGNIRSQIFRRIALKQVDFVLVHPGSRQVEQVVQIVDPPPAPHEAERRQIVTSVLDAAGITLREITSRKSYSVAELSAVLGLDAEE